MDPQPTDPAPASGPSGDADREARIEQLLLAGLDHYFAGQYERAIGVWTRVVFLERHHDRARAYIERARSAMAEQQRESDELVGSGVAAYNAGEVESARELLTRAAAHGSDTAQVFLDRLNRVGANMDAAGLPARRSRPWQHAVEGPPQAGRAGWAVAAAAVLIAVATLLSGLPLDTWLSGLADSPPRAVVSPPPVDPLPVVRSADIALARARALREEGRLRDAIEALERVGPADPLRGEADRLRGQIQVEVLDAAGLTTVVGPQPEGRP
jgi:tetratricopeptide (TPR) repeat protein